MSLLSHLKELCYVWPLSRLYKVNFFHESFLFIWSANLYCSNLFWLTTKWINYDYEFWEGSLLKRLFCMYCIGDKNRVILPVSFIACLKVQWESTVGSVNLSKEGHKSNDQLQWSFTCNHFHYCSCQINQEPHKIIVLQNRVLTFILYYDS